MDEYKEILFVPGFLANADTLKLIPEILEKVQPAFNDAGWEIVISKYYQSKPTTSPLETYALRVAAEIDLGDWDGVIAHSMGGILLPEELPRGFPVAVIEAPVNGVTKWQFRLINFLALLKGQPGFPLDNISVQGMLRGSAFMRARNSSPDWAQNALQINGLIGCSPLSRWGGNTFGKIPGVGKDEYKEFPKVSHVGLLTNQQVIAAVLEFLDDFNPDFIDF